MSQTPNLAGCLRIISTRICVSDIAPGQKTSEFTSFTKTVDLLPSELQACRVRLEDFPHPADFRNVGAFEFVPVPDAIVHFVDKEAAQTAGTVGGDGCLVSAYARRLEHQEAANDG